MKLSKDEFLAALMAVGLFGAAGCKCNAPPAEPAPPATTGTEMPSTEQPMEQQSAPPPAAAPAEQAPAPTTE